MVSGSPRPDESTVSRQGFQQEPKPVRKYKIDLRIDEITAVLLLSHAVKKRRVRRVATLAGAVLFPNFP